MGALTKLVKYWAMRLGEGGKYVDQGRKGDFVAIGWEKSADLTWLNRGDASSEQLVSKLSNEYLKNYGSNLSKNRVAMQVGQLIRFVRDMGQNDIVVVPDTARRKIMIGKITSDYQYKPNWGDECSYQHRRDIGWLKEIDRNDVSEKLRNSLGAIMTVWSLERHHAELDQILTGVKTQGVSKTVTGKALLGKVVDRFYDMSWKDFQDFVANLLGNMGFDATTTQYVSDKGVDVIGNLNAEGIANITLRVQVKRVRGNVGIEEVQRIRGTLEKDEHGSIVTSGGFTKQAQEEAQAPNKVPISLIDGEKLAELLLGHYDDLDEKYREVLGVRRVNLPIWEQFSTDM